MGPLPATEIDAWLRNGGLVVTASDRAARAVSSSFHRARRAQGLAAWPAPNILDWRSFVREAWSERSLDGRLPLNPLQEQNLWAEIVGAEKQLAALLAGPRHHLAALAMEAHELLCLYAPESLRAGARSGWDQDAAAFDRWLTAFDQACLSGNLLSPARMPLELIPLLQAESSQRPPLLLAGFDRILPVQRHLFDAWGEWRNASPEQAASQVQFHQAEDAQSELTTCALWCKHRLAASPTSRILVVTQDTTARRGEIERAFLAHTGSNEPPLFEFSLGVPLSQVGLTKAAHLLLRWMSGPLAEHEMDWLFSTGHAAANAEESAALQHAMRRIRHCGQQQPEWTLAAFTGHAREDSLSAPWAARMTEAQRILQEKSRSPQTPLAWAEFAPQLLQSAAWPGARPLTSAEFQAADRWNSVLETCASLGFDGRRIEWQEFLSVLARTLDETLFAPESRDAPIQITGPAESAGLTADAILFLGAGEDAWPAAGATHPLLPLALQRQAAMPHATPQLDWDLASSITGRLLTSAPEVHFSFAGQIEGVETRASRLVVELAGSPQPLSAELIAPATASPLTVPVSDLSRIPFPPGKVEGGAAVLTAQSQCPFKAFATARLGAKGWEPAEAGLTAPQRGQLLHAVLHSIWAGPPDGIRTHEQLQDLKDPSSFVDSHVHRVLAEQIRPALRERMPRRYLELEAQRLTKLVTDWLEYEAQRIAFIVEETEVERTVHIAGLTFDLRLDRIDRLIDDSLLVIDYKSGAVSLKAWDLPRPDDVQLPLYAGFALDRGKETLSGLVFAKIRAGDLEFAGRVGDATATLRADLSPRKALKANPLTAEQLDAWRQAIEQLARDYLVGSAQVDPSEYPKTCERCGLQTLCRIRENQPHPEDEDETEDDEGAADE
jgi:probable DNA repair protein